LYAVAHNIAVGSLDTTIGDLKSAVEWVKPLIDAHFASNLHAVGTVEDHEEPEETVTPQRTTTPERK